MGAIAALAHFSLLFLACAGLSAAGGALQSTPSLVERNGDVLQLADGVLLRFPKGEEAPVALGCSESAGTGRVLAIAADPAGPTFVAAERGLFVTAAGVSVLDPVRRAEGAPPGAPLALHLDERRRLWLATDEAVGVLEPSFYYGRTLGSQELPGAGPYRLRPGLAGELVLSGTAGEKTYRPDRGPARGNEPRVTRVLLDDQASAPDAELELAYGERPVLRADGSGEGGASLRFRVDEHHVWRHLGGATELELLGPGEHTLDVVAFDRDLNRSEPHRVRLRVEYPLYYSPAFVVTLALGVSLSVVLFFLWRARARSGKRRSILRAVVSAAIVLALTAQVVAGLVPHGKGWPLMGFDMYTDRYAKNDVVYDAVLVGIDRNGYEFVIDPQSVGIAVDSRWQVLRPLIDRGDSAARSYAAAFRERHPKTKLRWLQVQARRVRLTPEGPVQVAPLVLYSFEDEDHGG